MENREIKFRAWWREKSIMLNNVQSFYDTLGDIDNGNEHEPEDSFGGVLESPEKYAVMQYTGLRDCDGVDVYEGDIVEFRYGHQKPDDSRFIMAFEYHAGKLIEIGWEHDEAMFVGFILRGKDKGEDWFTDWPHTAELRVIGNIYENPELLEA